MKRQNRQAMPWKLKKKRTFAFRESQGLNIKELYVAGNKIEMTNQEIITIVGRKETITRPTI